MSSTSRYWLISLGYLQNCLFSGLIYGWASIAQSPMLQPFQLTLDQTTTIFSIAASCSLMSSLVLGTILDLFGPRIASSLAHGWICCGLLGFASAATYHQFLVSAILIAFGGPGIQASVIHLANLFPHRNHYLILVTLSGSITLSFAVLPLLDTLWEHGVEAYHTNNNSLETDPEDVVGIRVFRRIFGAYAALAGISMVASLLFWPNRPFQKPGKGQKQQIHVQNNSGNNEHINDTTQLLLTTASKSNTHHNDRPSKPNTSFQDQPFLSQLFSGTYLRILLMFAWSSFVANFFVAAINPELVDAETDPAEQRLLTRSFTLLSSCGFFVTFLIGTFMDRFGLELAALGTLALGFLHTVFLGAALRVAGAGNGGASRLGFVLSFVCYTVFRQGAFQGFFAAVSQRHGVRSFGMLTGIGFAVSGLLQFGIAPLVRVVSVSTPSNEDTQGYWKEKHQIQAMLFVVMTVIPYCDWRKRVKEEEDIDVKATASLQRVAANHKEENIRSTKHSFGSTAAADDNRMVSGEEP